MLKVKHFEPIWGRKTNGDEECDSECSNQPGDEDDEESASDALMSHFGIRTSRLWKRTHDLSGGVHALGTCSGSSSADEGHEEAAEKVLGSDCTAETEQEEHDLAESIGIDEEMILSTDVEQEPCVAYASDSGDDQNVVELVVPESAKLEERIVESAAIETAEVVEPTLESEEGVVSISVPVEESIENVSECHQTDDPENDRDNSEADPITADSEIASEEPTVPTPEEIEERPGEVDEEPSLSEPEEKNAPVVTEEPPPESASKEDALEEPEKKKEEVEDVKVESVPVKDEKETKVEKDESPPIPEVTSCSFGSQTDDNPPLSSVPVGPSARDSPVVEFTPTVSLFFAINIIYIVL